MPKDTIFEVVFNSQGVCVGKLRNEVTNTAIEPFQVCRMLATDEGRFQGGEDTSPTPLEFFLTGLVGCLMTQIRVFARRKKIDMRDLKVSCRAHWEAMPDPALPASISAVSTEERDPSQPAAQRRRGCRDLTVRCAPPGASIQREEHHDQTKRA